MIYHQQKENKLLEEKRAALNENTTGQTLNKSEKSKHKPGNIIVNIKVLQRMS